MRVFQIPVPSRYRGAWELLQRAGRPTARANLPERLWPEISGPPPPGDRAGTEDPRVPSHSARLTELWQSCEVFGMVRRATYYPAGGGVGWHTNSDAPGWRVYLVRADGTDSFLRTEEGTYPDRDGWANVFQVGPGTWHCVGAHSERWSVGFLVSGYEARALLASCEG